MDGPIRVLIYEDNDELRSALGMLISSDASLELVGTSKDATVCEKQVFSLEPDVVIMDINMPGISGIEAAQRLSRSAPQVKVLMHTVFEDEENLFSALENGACGYILKRSGPLKVIEACKDAYDGGAPITPLMANLILKRMAPSTRSEHGLSEREQDVLRLLVDGHSYKTIGTSLFVSVDTVRSHIRNIYEKLHVHSKSEAVAKALRDRIV
jgi:DNA-binding NarL/FixJ family response regulator